MAKESDDESDFLKAIVQVIKNCSVDPKFDINKLAIFDLEYVLRPRGSSIER